MIPFALILAAVIPQGFYQVKDMIDYLYGEYDVITAAEAASQVHVESHFRKCAASAFAKGLTQFTPKTAEKIFTIIGCDPVEDICDPTCSLVAQKAYMNMLYSLHVHNSNDALPFARASYNAGYHWIMKERRKCRANPRCNSRRWKFHVENSCIRNPRYCRETKNYVRKIESVEHLYKEVFE